MKKWFCLTALFALRFCCADETISLDEICMNVVKTDACGVVNHETIFHFSQNGDLITANYAGGRIQSGFLVGKITDGNQLAFSYCQIQTDGKLDTGASQCEISRNEEGKIVLIEHFEWASRPGEFGTNIFQEYSLEDNQ